MAISARSNRALSRFWAGILCITILGVGVLELMGAPRHKAEKVATRDHPAVTAAATKSEVAPAANAASQLAETTAGDDQSAAGQTPDPTALPAGAAPADAAANPQAAPPPAEPAGPAKPEAAPTHESNASPSQPPDSTSAPANASTASPVQTAGPGAPPGNVAVDTLGSTSGSAVDTSGSDDESALSPPNTHKAEPRWAHRSHYRRAVRYWRWYGRAGYYPWNSGDVYYLHGSARAL